MSRRTPPHQSQGNEGLTLIELVVVITIIAVLAALVFAAMGGVQKSMARTKCIANLRQIGAAMTTYSVDHDGFLPGALWTWQSCWYRADDYGSLGTVLARELGLNPTGGDQRAEVLLCPAWQRGAPYREDEQFIMNTQVGDPPVNPWGDADIIYENGEPGLDPDGADMPKTIAALGDVSLPKTWAMQDLDQETPGPRGRTWYGIAPKPVHEAVRNTLFLDFHVEAVPVK